jgi:hypothetical protein
MIPHINTASKVNHEMQDAMRSISQEKNINNRTFIESTVVYIYCIFKTWLLKIIDNCHHLLPTIIMQFSNEKTQHTVKPVLRGHLWDNEKVVL